ncbi:hypothetical protein [Zooshikella harenae]|uniref:HEAT repeat domain-containing protein n=1 Tax=Zooshikella harenae TaxID=2827238 RepID=A0ABS5Z8Q4_9GAMM|nr:hypothetical protein [Zooshikella harenae]MBU2710417.1 hypothetical protein [Zooshikella harenae]
MYWEPLETASSEQLLAWWHPAPDWVEPEDHQLFYDELGFIISEYVPNGQLWLKQQIARGNLEQQCAALRHGLSRQTLLPEDKDLLLAALDSNQPEFQAIALSECINQQRFLLPLRKVQRLIQCNNEEVSALAEMYCCYALPTEQIFRLQRCLLSPSARTREAACDFIGNELIYVLEIALRKRLQDTNYDVRDAARENLAILKENLQ